MFHRYLLTTALIVFLLGIAPVALAQTPTPAGDACAPATPCVDESTATAGLRLGNLAVESVAPVVDSAAQEVVNDGFGLAWAVMAMLVLALLYAVVATVLATMGRAVPALPRGAQIAIPVLSVLGLGVALYLSYIETTSTAAVCGPVGDCNAVQASPFAMLFGFLPVGVLGAVGYIGILVAWFVGRRTDSSFGRLAPLLLFGFALFGVLFTIYLTYLELFVIRAVCIWCLASAVIMAFVLALSVAPALEALQFEDDSEEALQTR
jgi:uncharacterized membrane protein